MVESSAPPTERALRPIGSTIKHYELIRNLGDGGMSAVFPARDTRLGRREKYVSVIGTLYR